MNVLSCLSAVPTANAYSFGWPWIMGAEEARDKPPTIPASSSSSQLTFKVGNEGDFYVSYITLFLWGVEGTPAALTYINPDDLAASVRSDVRIQLFDTTTGRVEATEPMHWSLLAGTAGQPHWLHEPMVLKRQGVYTVRIINRETTPFAISLQFHGRLIRRQELPGEMEMAAKWIAKAKQEPRGVDYPAFLGVPSMPVSPTAGSYTTPGPSFQYNFISDADYPFFVRDFRGSQVVSGSSTWTANSTRPIFTSVFWRNAQYRMTNVPIPFGCLFGRAEFPGTLPVNWCLGRNAILEYTMTSMDTSTVGLQFLAGGFYRRGLSGNY